MQPQVISAEDGPSASHVYFVCNMAALRGVLPFCWDKKAAEGAHSEEWKAEELMQREKLICHMTLGSNRAVDGLLLAEVMFLRLGMVGVQARWGLVHSFLESTDLYERVLELESSGCSRWEEVIYMKMREREIRVLRRLRRWNKWIFLRLLFFPTLCVTAPVLYLWAGANERDRSFACLFLNAHQLFCIIRQNPVTHTLTTAACFLFWEYGQTVVMLRKELYRW